MIKHIYDFVRSIVKDPDLSNTQQNKLLFKWFGKFRYATKDNFWNIYMNEEFVFRMIHEFNHSPSGDLERKELYNNVFGWLADQLLNKEALKLLNF